MQSDDRCDDGCKSLSDRAAAATKGIKDRSIYAQTACEKWMDVRSFGQVFAFKSTDKNGVSVGVRGPVSIHQAVSISPVEIEEMQITKSVNGETGEKRASDTMGMKHFVRFGLYEIKGAINVQLAEKTGFTREDAAVIKECLRTLFVNDASSARPEGSIGGGEALLVGGLTARTGSIPRPRYTAASMSRPKTRRACPSAWMTMRSPWMSCRG